MNQAAASAMSDPATQPNRKPTDRKPIWVLIAMFFVPLAIAFVLYYGVDGWRPAGSTNHGDLVTPARPLPDVTLPLAQGGAANPKLLHGKWTLVYIGSGQCDARCREALTLIRQSRLALGDEMSRVQRVFLSTAECCDRPYLEQEHAGLITLQADSDSASGLLREFSEAVGASPGQVGQAGRIYIVDPLGNLMMSYAPTAAPRGLLEDLKKLLRLSHIG
jgi:cytochrome oxidase Cu insertion factor (SCO1/SenC/PrrC family)